VDEKEVDVPSTRRSARWGRVLISVLATLLAISALAVVVGNRGLEQNPPAAEATMKHDDTADKVAQEEAEAFLSRATGQQYLLGVGKADITG
jgi:hypothetical protein